MKFWIWLDVNKSHEYVDQNTSVLIVYLESLLTAGHLHSNKNDTGIFILLIKYLIPSIFRQTAYVVHVYWLCFSAREQCTTMVLPVILLLSHVQCVPNFSKGFFAQIGHVYLASKQKPSARLRRRLDQSTPADSLFIYRLLPVPPQWTRHTVRLSPAEQLGYGGVSGHDNLRAAHTTWCPHSYRQHMQHGLNRLTSALKTHFWWKMTKVGNLLVRE